MNMADQSIGELARDIPGATAVFHAHQLDFCCGGKHSLREAAAQRGVDIDVIVAELARIQHRPAAENSFQQLSDEELVEHILERFHDVHREQLPELIRLAQRVERVHGGHPACPSGLAAKLERMRDELEAHMEKEEKILFPMITRDMHPMAFAPIQMMRADHSGHGDALAAVIATAHGLELPPGACNTWRALYNGLAEFQMDLMEHIHLENNVLFDRIEREARS